MSFSYFEEQGTVEDFLVWFCKLHILFTIKSVHENLGIIYDYSEVGEKDHRIDKVFSLFCFILLLENREILLVPAFHLKVLVLDMGLEEIVPTNYSKVLLSVTYFLDPLSIAWKSWDIEEDSRWFS